MNNELQKRKEELIADINSIQQYIEKLKKENCNRIENEDCDFIEDIVQYWIDDSFSLFISYMCLNCGCQIEYGCADVGFEGAMEILEELCIDTYYTKYREYEPYCHCGEEDWAFNDEIGEWEEVYEE